MLRVERNKRKIGYLEIYGCARASISGRLTYEITCRAEDKRHLVRHRREIAREWNGVRAGMKCRGAEKSSGSMFSRSRRRYSSDGKKSEDKSRAEVERGREANTRSAHVMKDSRYEKDPSGAVLRASLSSFLRERIPLERKRDLFPPKRRPLVIRKRSVTAYPTRVH